MTLNPDRCWVACYNKMYRIIYNAQSASCSPVRVSLFSEASKYRRLSEQVYFAESPPSKPHFFRFAMGKAKTPNDPNKAVKITA